jgi:hypothetical protein
MDEALRHNDAKTFIGAARVSIADTRVAQQIRKMDLAELRLKLDQKRMEWEIEKHKLSLPPKPKRTRKLSPAEKRKRIRQILGTGPEYLPHYYNEKKHNKTQKNTEKTPTNEQTSLPVSKPSVCPPNTGESQLKQGLSGGAQNSSILAPNWAIHPTGNC